MKTYKHRSFVDSLNDDGWTALARQFDAADAAPERLPLPPGTYRCQLASGALITARTGTPGYELHFVVADGVHVGRRLWHRLWLTQNAMAMTKRDLNKLGITSLDMLHEPMPAGVVCEVRAALHVDDNGIERNQVTAFEVVAILKDPTVDDAFPSQLPTDEDNGGSL